VKIAEGFCSFAILLLLYNLKLKKSKGGHFNEKEAIELDAVSRNGSVIIGSMR